MWPEVAHGLAIVCLVSLACMVGDMSGCNRETLSEEAQVQKHGNHGRDLNSRYTQKSE